MNVLVIDTSIWIDYLRGGSAPTLENALKEGRAYLTVVVLAELLSSFRPESKRDDFVRFLRDLPLCDASFDHWTRVGDLRSKLARKGISISTPDAHIAQSAKDLDGYLLTHDKIFQRASKHLELKLLDV